INTFIGEMGKEDANFDTSNIYGPSQTRFGEAFRRLHMVPGAPGYDRVLRENIFLASKTHMRYSVASGESLGPNSYSNGERVQIFEFSTEAQAASRAQQVSADGTKIGTQEIPWKVDPHFFRKGRLIVVYGGSNASVMNSRSRSIYMKRRQPDPNEPISKTSARGSTKV
ncbi:MAG: hypothetical protein C4557_00975, partial [Anaerolineaceae bacterium]